MTTPPILQLAAIKTMAVAPDRKSVSFPIVLANGRRYQLEVQSDFLQTCLTMFEQAAALAADAQADLVIDP